MTLESTAEIIHLFNDAFVRRAPHALDPLVATDCVMEAVQPAPNGERVEGRDACLAFWKGLIEDPNGSFAPEHVDIADGWAVIQWRYTYGEGINDSVRGVNLMRIRDGKITEALGYSKTPALGE